MSGITYGGNHQGLQDFTGTRSRDSDHATKHGSAMRERNVSIDRVLGVAALHRQEKLRPQWRDRLGSEVALPSVSLVYYCEIGTIQQQLLKKRINSVLAFALQTYTPL